MLDPHENLGKNHLAAQLLAYPYTEHWEVFSRGWKLRGKVGKGLSG